MRGVVQQYYVLMATLCIFSLESKFGGGICKTFVKYKFLNVLEGADGREAKLSLVVTQTIAMFCIKALY